MTVDATPTGMRFDVTSSAIGTEYSITFPYQDMRHIRAYYRSPAAGATNVELFRNADFIVDGTTFTTLSVIPSGVRLVIFRQTDLTQEIDWPDGQAVFPPNIEKGDDKLTYILQEFAHSVNRLFPSGFDNEYANYLPPGLLDAIYNARDLALDAAERATTAATEAENAAWRAEDAARRTADDLVEVSKLADLSTLASGTALNVRKGWIVVSDVPAGTEYTMPMWYYVGRAHLMLWCNNLPCYMRDVGNETNGLYQFEEVGTSLLESNKVKFNFDLKAGDEIEGIALSSLTQTMYETLSEAVESAETIISIMPPPSSADEGDVLTVNNLGDAEWLPSTAVMSFKADPWVNEPNFTSNLPMLVTADGWYTLSQTATTAGDVLRLTSDSGKVVAIYAHAAGNKPSITLAVAAGEMLTPFYSSSNNDRTLTFIPLAK